MPVRFSLVLFLLSLSTSLWATNDPATVQQLEDVKTEIQNLAKKVASDKQSQTELFQQLKQQSRAISKLNRTLIEIKQQELKKTLSR
ncbi:MAG: hypothetical protein Q9N32_04045 [Gammaproteobacteria bacterium]|nr:hypothetical protein [Gammaproteobacteria bacterium]